MPSMMMPFEVRDEKEIASLKLGDAISFRLNVTQRDSWIDRIQKIDAGQLHLPAPAPTIAPTSDADGQPRLHEGDPMPAFHLIDQDGKPVTLETFHGHPFVVTFIFTRCPIPNFCPRMSQNFAALQKAIQTSPEACCHNTTTQHLVRSGVRHAGNPQAIRPTRGSRSGDLDVCDRRPAGNSKPDERFFHPGPTRIGHDLAQSRHRSDRSRREDRENLARQWLDPRRGHHRPGTTALIRPGGSRCQSKLSSCAFRWKRSHSRRWHCHREFCAKGCNSGCPDFRCNPFTSV